MMKSICLVAAILIASANMVHAGGNNNENESAPVSFTGQVLDMETGEALAGVLIRIDNEQNSIYTDFEGRFELPAVIPGSYRLNASLISYDNMEMDIVIDPDRTETIKIGLDQARIRR